MASPQGPPRPRPGFSSPNPPPPNPNYLAPAMLNLHLGPTPPPFPSNGPFASPPSIPPAARPPSVGAPPPSRPPSAAVPPAAGPFVRAPPAGIQPPVPGGPPVRPPQPSSRPFPGAQPGAGFPGPTPGAALQQLPPTAARAPQPFSAGPRGGLQQFPSAAVSASQPFPAAPPGGLQPFPSAAVSAPQPFPAGSPGGLQPIPSGAASASQPFPAGPPSGLQPFPSGAVSASQPFPAAPPGGLHLFPGASPGGSRPFFGVPPSSSMMVGGQVGSQGLAVGVGAGGVYGSPAWSSQGPQVSPPMPGGMQPPPRMFGMPTHAPHVPPMMGQSPFTSQVSTPSKIDPNQIPHPAPSSSILQYETRQGGQATVPPPSTSDFIVRDYGNCSPRYMRSTIHQIPCTADLLSTSSMSLALLVQPLALPHPSEEPIQVVDFGESGPLRCSRCKGYINPFMKFVDHGRRFICNMCGFNDETPREYQCNLGPDGRRHDADERPELCRGTVEFVATKEYMVREPMPAVFFFLVDVSMNAVQTGATASACTAISQAIADLPEGPRTMVGIATFDSTIHFYNLKRSSQQPMMLIVPDVQDVYTPLHSDLIVKLTECRQHLAQLLENIPSMFENNKIAESAFGAAMKASFLAMKPTGGKLLVFQSVLPSAGIGSLSMREAEGRTNISTGDKEAHKLLQPADKTLKEMAIEFAESQVCVDTFITTQNYVDIASISVVPRTTGGQVYYYHPFSADSDSAKLFNDLRWNLTRPQGFEAVMRVRCSQGLQVQEYHGNFCKRIPTDIDLPGIDCDKTIMVTFKHDDKFQEGSECAFQCALLYTTIYGQRRIRVTTLSLPCTNMLSNLFRSADLDSQFACFLKQAAIGIPSSSLSQVRDQMQNLCINILHSYRKYCATVSSSGQLILPEALKLLPLYTLALIKSIGLRTDGRLDDRSYWVTRAVFLSTALSVPFVYPRMIAIHDLAIKEDDGSLIPPTIPLSSEHVTDNGMYLLENGDDGLIYVGNLVDPGILQQVFGVSSIDALPTQLTLQQYDNKLSKKVNDVLNEMRRQRCSYVRLRLCRKGDPSGMLFFSYMIEDKIPAGLSYVEFLVHIHRQIQTKMA